MQDVVDVVVDVVVAVDIPSPKDTPAMAIPMIKSSFGFVIVVSYLFFFLLC
jgi:hypothetical protein